MFGLCLQSSRDPTRATLPCRCCWWHVPVALVPPQQWPQPEDSYRASVPNRLHFDSFPPPFPQPLQKKFDLQSPSSIHCSIILLLRAGRLHPRIQPCASSPFPGCQGCYSHWYVFLACRNSRVGAEWKEMLPDLGRLGPQANQGEGLWELMAEQEVEHDGKKNEIYLPCTKQESNLNPPNCFHSSW